jgi:hypothetical protein
MKNPLLRFVSALGLPLGALRATPRQQTHPDIIIRGKEPMPDNRQEHRQGKRFRSQKERSNRRKASR